VGEKPIVYHSPYVPAEWIAAHGFTPCRLTPSGREESSFPGMGVCPYAAAFVQAASIDPDTTAIVMTTACDQMRRLSENVEETADRPLFLMHLPAAVEMSTAMPLYREEVLRLGRFLEKIGGARPDAARLAETMTRYDEARRALRAARDRLKPRTFAEALMRFQRGDWTALDTMEPDTVPRRGTPVALAGGPLRSADLVIFDEVEAAGGWVAIDATSTGERTLPRPFDEQALHSDPMEELLMAYWAIP
jgi:benzoyl-CoA reductase/2-hydroxyglutaryl-CoA dehydratase subunit BcrC/BadD/HgdB